MKTLYHGSNELIKEIHNKGIFGGLFFASELSAAESHGDYVHVIDLDEHDILTDYILNYHSDFDVVKNILTTELTFTDDEFDEIYEAVVSDSGIYNSSLEE